ncbi:MAG: cation diffusion facilitator family transporter [Fidelibacterota bacterium]
MSHHHTHHNHGGIKNIKIAFILNLSFTVVEIIGGILTNSIAIISDALHDLGDSLSLGLSWYLEKVSQKRRDPRFSFGYRRFSLLGALINSIVLIGGSAFVLTEAIPRLLQPEAVHVKGMLGLSIFGILINGIAAWRIKSGTSMNEKVISWHLLEDVLGWVAIFITSLVMLVWSAPILDPVLSILITAFVLFNVVKRLLETLKIFLQAIPPDVDIQALEQAIVNLEEVQSVHDTHIWSLDGEYTIMSLHIVVATDLPAQDYGPVKQRIRALCQQSHLHHVTIEIEQEDEDCDLDDC